MTSYAVNLDLLRAMQVFTSRDKSRPILNDIAVAFDPDGETGRLMFAASDSHVLAVGTAHANDASYTPAAVLAEWEIMARAGKAMLSSDAVDVLHKLTPKPGKNSVMADGSTAGAMLNIESDGQDRAVSWLTTGSWSSEPLTDWDQYPNIGQLLTIGTDVPEPVADVQYSPDVLTKLCKAAKLIDGAGIVLHGAAAGGTGNQGRQFWSIKSGPVMLVGVAMPIRSTVKWLGE